jgi:hypothetical protein
LPLPPEPVVEAFALNEGHGEPELSAGLARVEHGQDVRVLQTGDGLDLAEEALGPERGDEFRPEDLEGDGAVKAEVLGEIDGRHTPTAELALERVAIAEGIGKGGVRPVGHSPTLMEMTLQICAPLREIASSG